MQKAILSGKEVVVVDDLSVWKDYFSNQDRKVAVDFVDDARISTFFIGLDHSYGNGRPLWFETIIFGGSHNGYQTRYETWQEAEEGHKKAVELVKSPAIDVIQPFKLQSFNYPQFEQSRSFITKFLLFFKRTLAFSDGDGIIFFKKLYGKNYLVK